MLTKLQNHPRSLFRLLPSIKSQLSIDKNIIQACGENLELLRVARQHIEAKSKNCYIRPLAGTQ